jgi:hypothetical protein
VAARPDYPRKQQLAFKYGLSLEAYDGLVQAQHGRCASCQRVPERLVVDHDHTTGEVRGLLCNGCNVGLGFFRDSPRKLRKAAKYLERTRE